jgi:hypothetical protein
MFGLQRHILLGLLVGALLGAVVAGFGEALGYTLALGDGIFWGAGIGGVLASVPQFEQSGAVLTRRENRVLNTLVGIAGSVVLVGILVLLAVLFMELFF